MLWLSSWVIVIMEGGDCRVYVDMIKHVIGKKIGRSKQRWILSMLSKIGKLAKSALHWLWRYEVNSNKDSQECGYYWDRPLRIFMIELASLSKPFSSVIYQVGIWPKGLVLLKVGTTKFGVGAPSDGCW